VQVGLKDKWTSILKINMGIPYRFVDKIAFIEDENLEYVRRENTESDVFYFSNIESNLKQIKRIRGMKGTFLIKLPFAVNNDYLDIVEILKSIPNDIRFIDFYNMRCVRSIINDFFRRDKFYNFLLSREYIEAIIIQDLSTERKTKYGIVFEIMQHFFVNNLISITKDNTDTVKDVCPRYMQRMERLKLLRNLRTIKCTWFRCYVYHRIYDEFVRTSDRSLLRDTYTYLSMQIYNTRWFGVKITFNAGRGFRRVVDRTVIKFTKLAFKRLFARYYYREIYDEEREEIRYISLIFQDFPEPRIYLKIEFRRSIRRLIIMNRDDIEKWLNEQRDGMNEYEHFFQCFFNNNDVYYVRLEEVEEIYRIFWFFYNRLYGFGVYAENAKTPNLLYQLANDNFKD
ncbi:Glucose-6-phosphate 1-dehydrogenase, partial [Trachipleistophora hominis]